MQYDTEMRDHKFASVFSSPGAVYAREVPLLNLVTLFYQISQVLNRDTWVERISGRVLL